MLAKGVDKSNIDLIVASNNGQKFFCQNVSINMTF